jgi:hypothetical protein
MIDPVRTTRPVEGRDPGESEPIKAFRRDGWYNVWGLMLAVFVGLISACVYWIARLGFRGALDTSQFGYAAFFAAVLGICLAARWSVPYLLLKGSSIDPRNAALMRMWRPGWFFRRTVPSRPQSPETRGGDPPR